ncbi:uncharacterized protein YALI1_D23359g [Yarrowia lipolytica]|uniref:Uncharacterized protein n=1 Tax=Yarrowia lipolytica TaxID=4952 RepID=A0A1D8NF53_YARLL|nr:hypothetical protein YALI1_D23359g [Yarrowia lipolytica]
MDICTLVCGVWSCNFHPSSLGVEFGVFIFRLEQQHESGQTSGQKRIFLNHRQEWFAVLVHRFRVSSGMLFPLGQRVTIVISCHRLCDVALGSGESQDHAPRGDMLVE